MSSVYRKDVICSKTFFYLIINSLNYFFGLEFLHFVSKTGFKSSLLTFNTFLMKNLKLFNLLIHYSIL